jgi:peptidoglycan/LPS O-acetylase OafA/YrhL
VTESAIQTSAREQAPSPAVAPPPGNPRFPLLDTLRALAVMVIVLFHVASVTGSLNTRTFGRLLGVLGSEAVVLFFVMSAFLLYRPFIGAHAVGRKRPSALRFGRRRLLRIIPAFWVALTLLAIWPGINGVFTHDWWRYYAFLQIYSQRTYTGGLPVAWTLCVEMTFYLMVPFWAMGVRRLHFRPHERAWLWAELVPVAVLMAGGIAVTVAARKLWISQLVGSSILGQSVWLGLGMALATITVVIQHSKRESRIVGLLARHPFACWAGAAGLWAAVTLIEHSQPGVFGILASLRTPQPVMKTIAVTVLEGLMAALIVSPAIFGHHAVGLLRRTLGLAPLVWLGLVSYGLYLYHIVVVELLGQKQGEFSASGLNLASKLHHAGTPVLFLMTMAVTAALAGISYYVVELPFLRLKEPVKDRAPSQPQAKQPGPEAGGEEVAPAVSAPTEPATQQTT